MDIISMSIIFGATAFGQALAPLHLNKWQNIGLMMMMMIRMIDISLVAAPLTGKLIAKFPWKVNIPTSRKEDSIRLRCADVLRLARGVELARARFKSACACVP